MLVPAIFKRPATDDPQCPSARLSRRVAVESRAHCRWSVEPNSIQSMIRDNSRDRLYVPPEAWTLRQLRLLNCRFTVQKKRQLKESLQSQVMLADSPVQDFRNTPSNLPRAMTQFGGRRTLEVKKSALKEILGAYVLSGYPFTSAGSQSQLFGRRAYSPATPPPFNEPVFNTRDKKLWSLQPANPVEDPYIMGILIALAQAQWRHRQRNGQHGEGGHTTKGTSPRTPSPPHCSTGRSPPDRGQGLRVNVLATSGVEDDCLYVYTASISAAILGKFDEPWRSSSNVPVVVAYYRIPPKSPIKPLNRLHRVLCAGSSRFCTGNG
ncbi:hypothetical protein BDV32DRAFT_147456 [Aspergillus pseudonomiae]|nr:hypothetical protein BDV32DRAFT_147456 [Aspergillus pseudonomiae]